MVSAAARRSILVGGVAPPVQKIGGGATRRGRPIEFFFKDSRINFFLSSKFSDDLFDRFYSQRKLQQNNYAATMTSAARRQIIGSGAPINNSRQRLGDTGARLYSVAVETLLEPTSKYESSVYMNRSSSHWIELRCTCTAVHLDEPASSKNNKRGQDDRARMRGIQREREGEGVI